MLCGGSSTILAMLCLYIVQFGHAYFEVILNCVRTHVIMALVHVKLYTMCVW